MFGKVAALTIALTLLPAPAEAAAYQDDCRMNSKDRNGAALFADISSGGDCAVHAIGYYKGVVDLSDEIWFSLPKSGLTWEEGLKMYGVWVMDNEAAAEKLPPYVCIIRSLAQRFPKAEER